MLPNERITGAVMNLFRIKLIPQSPWRTPWQADTLTGRLCAICAHIHEPDFLRERLIEPMLKGKPPFVLSDACPGDFLPMPLSIRMEGRPVEQQKVIRDARWVACATFDGFRQSQGLHLLLSELYSDKKLMLSHACYHNTLSRLTDTTGEADSGLGLFSLSDIDLRTHEAPNVPNPLLNNADYLSIYFRVADSDAMNLLLNLLSALEETGFGADIATGRGQFKIMGDPEPMSNLDKAPADANAIVSLSTFQPDANDPTDGLWEAFPKFGKLGPELGLKDVRKRTLILFHPGACFRVPSPMPYLGRAIPMEEFLPSDTVAELNKRQIKVIHPAFGLTLPARLSWENFA
jgi:hypothetical protein